MADLNLSAFPRLRLAITLALTVAIGVLSSILASQIMPNGRLDWSLLPKVSSFWILLLVTVVWLSVQVIYMNYDYGLITYADDLHCEAAIRKLKLDALAADLLKNPEKAHALDATALRKDLGLKRRSI